MHQSKNVGEINENRLLELSEHKTIESSSRIISIQF